MRIEKINTEEFDGIVDCINPLIDKVNELVDSHNKFIENQNNQADEITITVAHIVISKIDNLKLRGRLKYVKYK